MNNSFLDQGHEAIANLPQNIDSLLFAEIGVAVDELFKIAIAYFLNDIVVVAAFHHVENSNYVLRFD